MLGTTWALAGLPEGKKFPEREKAQQKSRFRGGWGGSLGAGWFCRACGMSRAC